MEMKRIRKKKPEQAQTNEQKQMSEYGRTGLFDSNWCVENLYITFR